ncbi:bifunctional DNA primase/polymerase-like protein [Bosea sp. AK1]|uniref:AAA family ATPase n=1 Tax=Bosea sp. AK1 TaxID=2587160 RepID=UPI00114EE27D|nr:AAA family ATPase [Bosea sp. AK1]TQI74063.1 bifunctional DNA primase/polymerase-like protein [Bosea sp. AK1]
MDGLDPINDWFGERKFPEPTTPAAAPTESLCGAADRVCLDGRTAEPVTAKPDALPAEAHPAPMTILGHALAMAARGFRCFPLLDGSKRPRVKSWPEEATSDPAIIRSWFAAWPDSNYGVAAGEGVLILDVDASKNGYAALLDIDLPPTLTVKTPGGGEHQYFSGPDVANSVDRIAPGLDVRSAGGYVVGPGSFFADADGAKGYTGSYQITNDIPPAAAPESFVLLAGTPKERETGAAVSIDDPDDIVFAIHYLQKDAPIAVEGRGGNNTTYAVAARVVEIGVSAERAADLMAEHWNERCLPPWTREELLTLCTNAQNYVQTRQGSGGVAAAAADWQGAVVLPPAPVPARKAFDVPALDFDAMMAVQPREWLYGSHYIRGYVSATVAGGGAGKTALAIAEALAIATGQPLLGLEARERVPVAFLQLEDPLHEMHRRIRAVVMHYELQRVDVGGQVFVVSGRDMPVRIASVRGGGLEIAAPLVAEIKAWIKRRNVGLVVVDPFVKSHGVAENDAVLIDRVVSEWADIANECGCAVELLHHVRKTGGQDVTAEDARGSTALHGAVRSMRTVNAMSQSDAGSLGVRREDAWRYFRVDNAKANMAPRGEASWRKLVSVDIGNSTFNREADNIGVVTKWTPPDPMLTMTEERKAAALAHLAKGPDGAGSPWRASEKASGYAGVGIAEALELDLADPQTRFTCRKLLKAWLADGSLLERYEKDNSNRRSAPFIYVQSASGGSLPA